MTKKSTQKIEFNALLKRVKQSDPSAQRDLYDYLVLSMYNTVFRILKNRYDTQDCLQISFSILFRKINQYDPNRGAFSTWSTRIFINESLRVLRKNKVNFEEVSDKLFIESTSNSPIENLKAEDILRHINMLPDQFRVIFNLYEIEGYSHKEIAEILGIAESSSRTYLTRAKVKLRTLLQPTQAGVTEFSTIKRSEG